jgi:hypothetical protein
VAAHGASPRPTAAAARASRATTHPQSAMTGLPTGLLTSVSKPKRPAFESGATDERVRTSVDHEAGSPNLGREYCASTISANH